jgi:hypothetical protein
MNQSALNEVLSAPALLLFKAATTRTTEARNRTNAPPITYSLHTASRS